MLSPTVVVPVSLVGAIIDRPLVRLKLIFAAALLKPPYRCLGLVLHKPARLVSVNVPSVSVGRDALIPPFRFA